MTFFLTSLLFGQKIGHLCGCVKSSSQSGKMVSFAESSSPVLNIDLYPWVERWEATHKRARIALSGDKWINMQLNTKQVCNNVNPPQVLWSLVTLQIFLHHATIQTGNGPSIVTR